MRWIHESIDSNVLRFGFTVIQEAVLFVGLKQRGRRSLPFYSNHPAVRNTVGTPVLYKSAHTSAPRPMTNPRIFRNMGVSTFEGGDFERSAIKRRLKSGYRNHFIPKGLERFAERLTQDSG